MRRADEVAAERLEVLQVAQHRRRAGGAALERRRLVAVDAFEEDRLAVEEDLAAARFDLADAEADRG